jgi:hypothetical protein
MPLLLRTLLRAAPAAGSLWAVLVALSGCSQPDPIREYVVKRPPTAGSLWFFKLIGPEDAVAAAAAPLKTFVESVRFNERSGLPEWTLPAGWTEEQSAGGVRYKTLKLPGDKGLEVAVTQISGKVPMGPEEERVHVNMLRGSVGLPAEEPGQAESAAGQPLATGVHAGKLFDFHGETPNLGKTRLLAAMVAVPLPPSAGEVTTTGETLPFTYEAPAEWQSAPPTQFSVVSMAITDGEETASMTITPAMGGILANVNRWRGQAGLPSIEEAELPELLDPIEAGELTILYADVEGAQRSILGGVVPVESGTFFVKLDGPPRLVKDEVERFRKFLGTFRPAK